MPGAVFFLGFNGIEVVLVGWWLREYSYVGYVGEGFPDEVGEVGGDLEMGYFHSEKVSLERSVVVQSASCSCRGPWRSEGRLKCRLNLADAAWRLSIGSVRCSPLGQVGGKVTGEKFDQSAILLFLVGVVEHFAVVSGVVRPVLSSPGLVGAAERAISLAMNSRVGAVVRLR